MQAVVLPNRRHVLTRDAADQVLADSFWALSTDTGDVIFARCAVKCSVGFLDHRA